MRTVILHNFEARGKGLDYFLFMNSKVKCRRYRKKKVLNSFLKNIYVYFFFSSCKLEGGEKRREEVEDDVYTCYTFVCVRVCRPAALSYSYRRFCFTAASPLLLLPSVEIHFNLFFTDQFHLSSFFLLSVGCSSFFMRCCTHTHTVHHFKKKKVKC